MISKKKIILDTDIGDDIDDVFALDFLSKSSEADFIGVTTVFRNAFARAKMAAYSLELFGRSDVPVYAGADKPLINDAEQLILPHVLAQDVNDENGKPLPCQYIKEMDNAKIENKTAIEFIAEQARIYKKELYIVAIGPLTNLALAIRCYPDLMKNIGGITLMGGNFSSCAPEWNIIVDPEAAEIVFSSGLPVKAIGYDLTQYCGVTDNYETELRLSNNQEKSYLAHLIQLWHDRYHFDAPVLHDVLAVAVELFDDLVEFKQKRVKVRLDGTPQTDRGATLPNENGSPIFIGNNVNVNRFMDIFYSRI